jgi:uncharacterized protein (UPF0335 family)
MNDTINNVELEQLMQRIETGENEVKDRKDFVKDIYSEAKARGYDTKIMRKLHKMRMMEKQALQEEDAMISIYRDAVNI